MNELRTAQPKQSDVRSRRRKQDVFSHNKRLAMPTSLRNNPDYVFRWVNDTGSRISEALANDYDFANEAGEEVDRGSSESHKVHVGTQSSNEPMFAFLMRKRKEWHDKDKKSAQDRIDENMKQQKMDAENPADPMRYKSKNVPEIKIG